MNRWPMVSLGELLAKSEEWVEIVPDQKYKEVTVRLWGKGVALRGETLGTEIASSRLKVHANQFIISKIDARNGASGLVPDSLEGAVVSNDFPVFTPNPSRIEPRFLAWLSKTSRFVDLCKAASEGTTNRVRLKEERFLATVIPLPPLEEQRRSIEHIEVLAANIQEAEYKRDQAIKEIEYLRNNVLRTVFLADRSWKQVRLGDVLLSVVDCLHSNPAYADEGVPTVRSPDVGWGTLLLATARRTSEAEYNRRTVRGEPMADDIIVVREGGGTGKAGIVLPGHRFSLGQRVMMLHCNASLIQPKFLLYQWLSPLIYEDQILPLMKGSASPHLNISTTKQFKVVAPDLQEQRVVVERIEEILSRIDQVEHLQTTTFAEIKAMMPAVLNQAFNWSL
jgi:type I restriction enzyme, S subunit